MITLLLLVLIVVALFGGFAVHPLIFILALILLVGLLGTSYGSWGRRPPP